MRADLALKIKFYDKVFYAQKVPRARCSLRSGSDCSKQKFKAQHPHQLQILPWLSWEGEEQRWILQTLSFRWDFPPHSPWESLNPHFLVLFIFLLFPTSLLQQIHFHPWELNINWLKFHFWPNPQIPPCFIPIQTIHGLSLTLVICTEITL